MRILFLRSAESKDRLKTALIPGNVDKTMSVPVITIIAFDSRFYDDMGRNFPHNPNASAFFSCIEAVAAATAFPQWLASERLFPPSRPRSQPRCTANVGLGETVIPQYRVQQQLAAKIFGSGGKIDFEHELKSITRNSNGFDLKIQHGDGIFEETYADYDRVRRHAQPDPQGFQHPV